MLMTYDVRNSSLSPVKTSPPSSSSSSLVAAAVYNLKNMATGLAGGVNGCSESVDLNDSPVMTIQLDEDIDSITNKRTLHPDGVSQHWFNEQMSFSPSSAGQQGGNGTLFHLKILVPAVAAGAIIGKGGETIAQLQKDASARVKMSKANDFYPGTTERVCLISGSVESILRIHEFIMEKIKEKPDPNAKVAIDFDHKQPAEREKQVKILVPNSTAGMIIGKGGSFIKQIKEDSGAYVQISQKSRDHALAERCITVIGEMDCNKKACAMIVSKIVEDPQSGSCLNVSYQDVTGPVANFNPTGSPYANIGTTSGQSNVTNSNPSYSSNGSLNSLSPTLTNSFNSPQATGTAGMLQFGNVGLGPTMPPANSAQMIENIKNMLRVSGFQEDAVSEISAAMNTLANYGILGLGLGLGGMINSMNGTAIMGGVGMGVPNNPAANCGMAMSGVTQGGQGGPLYTTQAPGVTSLDCTNATSNAVATGAGGNGLFGPVGSAGSNISGININHGFGSPTNTRTAPPDRLTMPDGFDPFRRSSPSLGSPGAASSGPPPLTMNNNSFGLGTVLGNPSNLRKSPTPTDSQEGPVKLEIEVSDNIVGAILGHGGKSLVEIQRMSGANIQISKKGIYAPGTRNRIVTICGSQTSVSTAQYLIEQQLTEEEGKRARQNPALTSVLR